MALSPSGTLSTTSIKDFAPLSGNNTLYSGSTPNATVSFAAGADLHGEHLSDFQHRAHHHKCARGGGRAHLGYQVGSCDPYLYPRSGTTPIPAW